MACSVLLPGTALPHLPHSTRGWEEYHLLLPGRGGVQASHLVSADTVQQRGRVTLDQEGSMFQAVLYHLLGSESPSSSLIVCWHCWWWWWVVHAVWLGKVVIVKNLSC